MACANPADHPGAAALAPSRQAAGTPASAITASTPSQTSDSFTPGRSLAVGALLSGVNPKNLMLNAAAAASIAQAGLSGGEQAVVLVVLVLLGSLGIIAPVAIYFAMGDRAVSVLDEWKTWLAANSATVMTVLFVVFGAVLIGKGIGGLS